MSKLSFSARRLIEVSSSTISHSQKRLIEVSSPAISYEERRLIEATDNNPKKTLKELEERGYNTGREEFAKNYLTKK